MKTRSESLADKAVQLCLDQYNKLPKSGKPTNDEWTVISAIVEHSNDTSRVVSLGTGSKCLGSKSLSPHGEVIHDAHAEVMARRGFLIYVMEEIRKWHQKETSSIFRGLQDRKLVLCEEVKFSLVTSTVPCGDAAIMPMNKLGKHSRNDNGGETAAKKQKIDSDEEDELPEKRVQREETDCHRTGAKCLSSSDQQDPKKPGAEFHVTGQVRTKPGRGDPTCSVSCSDKLARWNAVGIQGALLSLLIHDPIFIQQIIVSGDNPFSEASLERAINHRIGLPSKTKFLQARLAVPFGKNEARKRPAPGSIAWNLSTNQAQVCVEGRKLGASKTADGKAALTVSKMILFERFVGLVQGLEQLPTALASVDVSKLSYRAVKDLSKEYQDSWRQVREGKFKLWTSKPVGLELFEI